MVHTCYKIGDQSPKDALLLRQRATQALWDIVTCAFRRAADFAAIPGFLDSPSDPAPASVFSPGDGGVSRGPPCWFGPETAMHIHT